MVIETDAAPRYAHVVGFMTPPAAVDWGPIHFRDCAAQDVGTVQHICAGAGFDYDDAGLTGSGNHKMLRTALGALADTGVSAVGQIGGYWATSFTPDRDTSERLGQTLTKEFNTDVVLVWNTIFEAIETLGARTLAISTAYLRPAWAVPVLSMIRSGGFRSEGAAGLLEQGIVGSVAELDAIEAATGWDYPDAYVKETCRRTAAANPEAEAILLAGGGMRALYLAAEIEAETGLPLVSSDIALYHAMLRRIGCPARPGFGTLLDTIAIPKPTGRPT